jgi:hypothetical protein
MLSVSYLVAQYSFILVHLTTLSVASDYTVIDK